MQTKAAEQLKLFNKLSQTKDEDSDAVSQSLLKLKLEKAIEKQTQVTKELLKLQKEQRQQPINTDDENAAEKLIKKVLEETKKQDKTFQKEKCEEQSNCTIPWDQGWRNIQKYFKDPDSGFEKAKQLTKFLELLE